MQISYLIYTKAQSWHLLLSVADKTRVAKRNVRCERLMAGTNDKHFQAKKVVFFCVFMAF